MQRVHRQVVQYPVRNNDQGALGKTALNRLEKALIEFPRYSHELFGARLPNQLMESPDLFGQTVALQFDCLQPAVRENKRVYVPAMAVILEKSFFSRNLRQDFGGALVSDGDEACQFGALFFRSSFTLIRIPRVFDPAREAS